MTKIRKKSTYKETLTNIMALGFEEEQAKEKVQELIEKGLVGDPKNRKTCNWKFEGTDMTINPSTGPQPKKSSKAGANNVRTHDLNISSKLLKVCYGEIYEYVKGLQQEGTFSKIDESVFVDEHKDQIVTSAKRTMLYFLENNTVK